MRLSSRSRDVLRRVFRRVGPCALVAVGVLEGCDRSRSPGADSLKAAAGAQAASTAAALAASGWLVEAGAFLVLPTAEDGVASGSLLRPEATELTVGDTSGLVSTIADGRVDVFARRGHVGTATLTVDGVPKVDSGCTAWPVARLAMDGSSTMSWTAAFALGKVSPISLDSIEGLASRDSARLAVELTRLASGLRDDTVATFSGLPFVVLRAWRSKGLDTGFIVATLARRVNQEDSPKEERLVMVVDQTGAEAKAWSVGWHERASGSEEELVVAEPLMSFRLGRSGDVHLLFGRDDGVALGAAVLSRGANGGWHVLWESAVAGCN